MHNAHGDVTGLRDSSGNVLNTYSYDIWGNPLTTQESVPQPFRYSGELWDSTTNLQYLRARWYDPSMGRFINEDSYEGQLTNPLSLNLYTYVHNNPLTHTDPTGHIISGVYAGINIDNATRYGSGSQLYWDVRSNLGSQAKSFFPGAYYDDNNQFKFLFGVATMTSDYTELNNEQDANWAREELVSAFEAQYNADLHFLDGLTASLGLRGSAKATPSKTVTITEATFLPDSFYKSPLPDFVSPGTKSLMKYDEAGELKQTKYYDDYGRQTGWVDWTNHGYKDPTSSQFHSTPHYHGIEYNPQYPVGGYKTDFKVWRFPYME